jgi:hypothetical protein
MTRPVRCLIGFCVQVETDGTRSTDLPAQVRGTQDLDHLWGATDLGTRSVFCR